MQIEILSIFPRLFDGFLDASLIGKARQRSVLGIAVSDIREYAEPPHFSTDDSPYGGGAGMVMKPEPLYRAIQASRSRLPSGSPVILLSPTGARFTQARARELSKLPGLTLVCGRYEGVDQRVIDLTVDEELSLGDYVLMGGEVAAMVVIEAVTRLIPSVVGNSASVEHESFEIVAEGQPLLEAPHYTRPPVFEGVAVPDVLLSGDHQRVAMWRIEQARARTARRRPDLLGSEGADARERKSLVLRPKSSFTSK